MVFGSGLCQGELVDMHTVRTRSAAESTDDHAGGYAGCIVDYSRWAFIRAVSGTFPGHSPRLRPGLSPVPAPTPLDIWKTVIQLSR